MRILHLWRGGDATLALRGKGQTSGESPGASGVCQALRSAGGNHTAFQVSYFPYFRVRCDRNRQGIFMPLDPTLETLKLLAGAIDANEDEIETAPTPDRRKRLSERLEWLQARFSTEYRQFLAATGQQEDSFTSAQTPERLHRHSFRLWRCRRKYWPDQ